MFSASYICRGPGARRAGERGVRGGRVGRLQHKTARLAPREVLATLRLPPPPETVQLQWLVGRGGVRRTAISCPECVGAEGVSGELRYLVRGGVGAEGVSGELRYLVRGGVSRA